MDNKLTQIVNVTISRETQAVTQAGFGVPLILGDSGKLPEVDTVVITFDAQLVTGNSIAWDFNGVAQSAIPYNSSHNQTVTDWMAAMTAKPEIASAVASDVGGVGYNNTITVTGAADPARCVFANMVVSGGASQPGITQVYTPHTRIEFYSSASSLLTAGGGVFASSDPEYLAAVKVFSQSPAPSQIAVGSKRSGDASWSDALAAIKLQDDTWYAVIATTRTKSEVEDIASWVESNYKLFGTASADSGVIASTTTDIAASLNSNNYDRSFCFYHPDADGTAADPWPEAALFGKALPKTPGSITWMFKSLSGVSTYNLTTSQESNALGKECNIYEEIGGANITREGTVASGEYIDVIRGVDWIQARMTEAVYGLLVRKDKVPFTDPGIASIKAEIQSVLDQAIANGIIAENTDPDTYDGKKYALSVPLASEVSANDKAQRKLTGITFTATLAGAIHYVEVQGVVTI